MCRQFKSLISLAVILAPALALAGAMDIGNRDQLVLSEPLIKGKEVQINVQVVNDEELLGLDIPLRFGQPGDLVELTRVDFAAQVSDWDITHALIDNKEKTVMLGLVASLGADGSDARLSASSEESNTIATLVFQVEGSMIPAITSFTTQRPDRSLSFVYNRIENGKPYVEEFAPDFTPSISFKLTGGNIPTEYALSQNFPNPFNPSTSFTLSLPKASDYSIRIFNITGQLVKSYSGYLEAGVHTIAWDGRNDQGSDVASGVYFYSAVVGGFSETKRMMLLR